MRSPVIVVLFVLGCFALAQAAPDPAINHKEMSEMYRKIRALKKKKIVEALALNKESADKILSVIDKYDNKRRESNRSMREDVRNLKKAVDDKQDDAVKTLVDKITQNRKDLLLLNQAEMDELKSVLTVEQQARYILFSIDFHKAIRRIIAEKRSRRDKEGTDD